ncbi:hypothetical protein MYAM1_003902 [Malassezia yamatoensis]|uniref:Uncharacterized protein n=1 Tax=Malassezia yamatoensis TaxID=253288 RepID=A0AAJ6CJD8_9BASI|nr:hypothetical protein MYAM1_003902 [Malassezia yamatoensis]
MVWEDGGGGDSVDSAVLREYWNSFAYHGPGNANLTSACSERKRGVLAPLSNSVTRRSKNRSSSSKDSTRKPGDACACILDTVSRDCFRILSRCSLCSSYYPASSSAPKRKAHLLACAAKRNISDEDLLQSVMNDVHTQLESSQMQWRVTMAQKTLYETLATGSSTVKPRWQKLTTELAIPSALYQRATVDKHKDAHAVLEQLLPDLVVKVAASSPSRSAVHRAMVGTSPGHMHRPAPFYEAAYRAPYRFMQNSVTDHELLQDAKDRLPTDSVMDHAIVPTSDDEDLCDYHASTYVETSDAEEVVR